VKTESARSDLFFALAEKPGTYLQVRATIHATPAQKLALKATESASPESTLNLVRS
jgi:hypothetical protein